MSGYNPSLDGLRAVSIALVLLAHGGLERIVPGGLGVTVFFFISGWLITGQLLDEHARTGRIALGRFYGRRALRLLPASTVFVLVAGASFVALGGTIRPLALFAAVLDLANLARVFTTLFDSTVPLPGGAGPLPHPFVILWSLSVEEHAYLLGPPLLALALARCGRRARPAVALLLLASCALSLGWRVHLAPICEHASLDRAHVVAWCGVHPGDRIYKGTDTRIDGIGWGALGAVLVRAGRWGARYRRLIDRPVASVVAAVLLLSTLVVRDPFFRDTLRYSLQGVAFLVLVPAATGADNPVRRLLARPGFVAVGRLSYGLYLWHWLALMLASRFAPGAGFRFVLLFALGSAGFALASWHLVERPTLRLRRRFGSDVPVRLAPKRAADPDPLPPVGAVPVAAVP